MAQKQVTETQTSSFAELTQETMLTAFHVATRIRESNEKLAQEIAEASLASQEAGARAAKDYVTGLHKARNEWVKKATEVSEKALSISPASLDFPWRNEVAEWNAQVIEGARRAFDLFTAPFAATARR